MSGYLTNRRGLRLRAVAAVVAGMATLAIPAAAQALPAGEPDYGVEGEPLPAPDLVVTATVEKDSSVNYQGRVIPEVIVTFTVKNTGKKAAGPFAVLQRVNHNIWYGSGGWTGERTIYVGGLAAGASQRLSAVWVNDESCVKALAIADSAKKVAEGNETNNFRSVVVEYYPGSCN